MQEKKQFTIMTMDDLSAIRGLGASAMLVFMALRIYGGKDSLAWPSQERISKDLDMPLPTVRKAFAALRKKDFIVLDGKAKTRRYRIMDISNMVCAPKTDDTNSDMPTYQNGYLDIPDRILTDTNSDIQKHKLTEKENINLIHKSKTNSENKNQSPLSVQEETVQIEKHSFTKKGPTGNISRADLLFLKLWAKQSERHAMVSDDLDRDWKRACNGYTQNQLIRGLKRLDVLMSQAQSPWNTTRGDKWIKKFHSWMSTEKDQPIAKWEMSKYQSDIDVDLNDLEKARQERRRAKEAQERKEAATMEPKTKAQAIWQRLSAQNPAWPDLVQAVESWAVQNLTEELRQQINNDSSKEMEDFKLLIR